MSQTRRPNDTSAAQRHLQAASELLLTTSPHTSAFLAAQLQCLRPPMTQSLPSNCRACGQHLVPGLSCTVTHRRLVGNTKASRSKEKVSKKPTVTSATHIDYKCTLCHNVNTFKSSSQPPRRQGKTSISKIEDSQKPTAGTKTAIVPASQPRKAAASTPSPALSTATSTSSEQPQGEKKRNRKQKLGGLQAMLAKSKATSAPSQGFDFMDFMKTN